MFTDENWLKVWQQGRIAWADGNPMAGDGWTELRATLQTDLPYNAHSQALWTIFIEGLHSLGDEMFAGLYSDDGPTLVFPSIRAEAVRRSDGHAYWTKPDDRLETCPCHGLVWSKYDLTMHVTLAKTCPLADQEKS